MAAVLGVAAALVLPRPPQIDAAFPSIFKYLGPHRSGIQASELLGLIGSIFALVFVVYLWEILRSAEPDTRYAPVLALVSGVAAVAFGWIQSSVLLATAAMPHQSNDGGLRALYDVVQYMDIFVIVPISIFLIAVAFTAVVTRVLPAWLGWWAGVLGLVLGVLAAVSIYSPSVIEGDFGLGLLLLFLLWLLATSMVLSLRVWPARVSDRVREPVA
jgi:hypothetical protein